MRDAYHPITFEHIPTDTPSDWMIRAGIPAPAYNPSIEGCFFKNGAWTIVSAAPQIIADAKASKKREIDAARDAACTADVQALGHTWQADTKSQQLLGQAITLAQSGAPLPPVWRTADNIDVPISSIADLLAIAGAIGAQVQAAYAKSWLLKKQLDAATTLAEVEAIVWQP